MTRRRSDNDKRDERSEETTEREKYCHPAWTTHRRSDKREEKGREKAVFVIMRCTAVFVIEMFIGF